MRGLRSLVAFLLALCCFILASCDLGGPENPGSRPDVLIVLVDELRFDAIAANGNEFFESPCIDRIADEGSNFKKSFVVTSLCSPSRASVLTGLHTVHHGLTDIWQELDLEIETLPTRLKRRGYQTAFIGKSHLNMDARPLPGFERWFSFIGQGEYVDPTINEDGRQVQYEGHMTDILTAEAMRFMRTRDQDRPYFMVLSHLAVHRPWIAQDRHLGRYLDAPISVPISWDDDFSDQPSYLECRQIDTFDPASVSPYYDVLAGVEDSMCELLHELERVDRLDDTLLIFTSDNGYFLGEHRLGDKRAAYEESIRIPLLVRYPRWFAAGTVVDDEIALNVDIAPTVLEAAGHSPAAPLDGISLRELASEGIQRDRFLYVYFRDLCSSNPTARCTPSMAAIRTLDHILVDYSSERVLDELYSLHEDPFQLHNRIDDASHGLLVDSLRVELDVLRSRFMD